MRWYILVKILLVPCNSLTLYTVENWSCYGTIWNNFVLLHNYYDYYNVVFNYNFFKI